jgi:hypothetical protein
VISPLLANVFLHTFDRAWAEHGTGELARYADDFAVLCSTRSQAEEAGRRAAALLGGARSGTAPGNPCGRPPRGP